MFFNVWRIDMIYKLYFRRYAPFTTFGLGFEGDSRNSASTDSEASARTIGEIEFSPARVGQIDGKSSGTRFSGFGEMVKQGLGTYTSVVTSSVTVQGLGIDCLRFTAHTSGANPMVPLPAFMVPAIDTFIEVHVAFRDTVMEIDGKVFGDDFPNCEVFVTDAARNACMLFEFATTGTRNIGPFTRLVGANRSQKLGEFCEKIPIKPDGGFVHHMNEIEVIVEPQ
jgi:hypothetical protein